MNLHPRPPAQRFFAVPHLLHSMLLSVSRPTFLILLVALLATSCQTPPAPSAGRPTASGSSAPQAAAAEPAPELEALSYGGKQDAVTGLDRDIAAAGTDAAKLSAIAERLVALLSDSESTFAARQAAAQRLGILLAGPLSSGAASSARGALAAMLENDLQTELARLALDPVPGDAIDGLFIDALKKSTGRKRLAIVQSLGARRTAAAVPHLAPLLATSDARLGAAAAKALGDIGGPAAISALRTTDIHAPANASALLAATRTLPATEALPLQTQIASDIRYSAAVRTAALRASLTNDSVNATPRILEILSGHEWELKAVALEAVGGLPSSQVVAPLAARLGTFDAPTQIAVIAALSRKADAGAVRAVAAAADHTDDEVRAAAVHALAWLPGDATTARLLAEKIARDPELARTARQSLAQLNGPEVSALILAEAQRGEAALRPVFIEQLALRHMTEAIPPLLAMRADPSLPIRAAAAAALGDLGGATEQQALLDWTIGATEPAEQARALRAFVTLTLRLPESDTRGQPLYAAIERAPAPLALRLLPALPRLGGTASAASAARLALGNDPAVAEAAAATLARWPDRSALPSLLEVAEKASSPAHRTTAAEAALVWLERNRETWTAEHTNVVARLLGSARDNETRRRLLVVLRRANDDESLALAEVHSNHATLADEARETIATIRAQRSDPPTFRASSGSGSLRNLTDGRPRSFWSVPAHPDHWLEIAYKNPRPIHQITLAHADRADNFPEAYEVFVTDDRENPGAPRASGAGQLGRTTITLPPGTRGRFVILKQTAERKESSLSVSELFVD